MEKSKNILDHLHSMNNQLTISKFTDLPYSQTGDINPGYFSWFQDWSTNIRYYVSTIQSLPFLGWQQPDFSQASQITMLGRRYIFSMQDTFQDLQDLSNPKVLQFLSDFHSLIWSSYRTNIRPLIRTSDQIYCSDTGWGCTIRAGQMLLLQALRLHYNYPNPMFLLQLIQDNIVNSPLSLHAITEIGKEYGKLPGDWYSPATICLVLSRLCTIANVPGLQVVTFIDSYIYKQELQKNSALLVCLPLMLGLGQIQEEYYRTIKWFLELEWSVGLIGGKPRSALYIVGYQGDNLLCLDPHYANPASKSYQELQGSMGDYFNSTPKLLPMSRAETSISVGFYFSCWGEFLKFEEEIKKNRETVKGVISVHERVIESNISDLSVSSEDEYVVLQQIDVE